MVPAAGQLLALLAAAVLLRLRAAGEMEIPEANDPLGHVDGLERPIPTPKETGHSVFVSLSQCRRKRE